MKPVRAFSSGYLEEFGQLDELRFKTSPDRPIHRPTQSLFTTSSGFNNFRGLFTWGCFLLLLTTSRMALENVLKYGIVMDPSAWLRFILQTHDKYLALGLLLFCNVFILVAWFLERLVSRQLLSHTVTLVLSCCNLFAVLAFPTLVIWYHDFNPLFSSPVLSVYTILFLKLWSYTAVNRWCRSAQAARKDDDEVFLTQLLMGTRETQDNNDDDEDDKERSDARADNGGPVVSDSANLRRRLMDKTTREKLLTNRVLGQTPADSATSAHDRFRATRPSVTQVESYRTMLDALEMEPHGVQSSSESSRDVVTRSLYVTYPDNVTLGNLYYFIFAPTLCYELNFPRTLTVRKDFIFKRLFEVVFISQLILCLAQQWMIPLLKNSVIPFAESNLTQIVERCLKLAIPNHFLWLLFFYSAFHSFLNLVGELTRFGDRFFYSDWWNAETVPAFWSKWNIPVHRFARRHIYIPLLNCGLSRPQAGMVVFFISALLHEYLISVPLKMPRMWAFLCMFSQMPYASLVHRLFPKGGVWGNVAVWITLIIGQPLAMLLYFHDYYIMNYAK